MGSNGSAGSNANHGVEERLDKVTDRLDRLVEVQQEQGDILTRSY